MKYQDTHNNDEFLDQLFETARSQAPKYEFTEASSVFAGAVGIGLATAAHAKLITSSIFKSKLFIMTVSTIAAITSAVFIYSATVKAESTQTKSTFEQVQPEKSFNQSPIQAKPIESKLLPSDTLKKKNLNTINEIKVIKLEVLDDVIYSIVTTDKDELKSLTLDLDKQIELGIRLESFKNAKTGTISDWTGLTLKIEKLDLLEKDLTPLSSKEIEQEEKEMKVFLENNVVIRELEVKNENINLGTDNIEIEILTPEVRKMKVKGSNDEHRAIKFILSENTTEKELKHIKEAAVEAGIKFDYKVKTKKGKIKKLNISMILTDENGENQQETVNITVSGDEQFSYPLKWYMDDNGRAIRFGEY